MTDDPEYEPAGRRASSGRVVVQRWSPLALLEHVGRGKLSRLSAVTLVAVVAVACGSTTAGTSSPNPSVSAHLMTVDELAAGQLGALPTGSQFARIVVFHQSPRQTVPSKKHQAGIIYVDTGLQLLTYTSGQSVDISGGAWRRSRMPVR